MRRIRSILNRLFHDSLGRDIVTLASGNAVSQILHLSVIPILMWLYKPSDFGIYAIYLAAVAVLAVLAVLRYDFAILLAEHRRTVFSLLTLCIGMVAVWCTLIAIAGVSVVHLAPAQSGVVPLRIVPFLPLGVGLSCLYTIGLQVGTRNQEYKRLRSARIVYSCTTLLAQIVLFFAYRSAIGLIIGEALGRLGGVLILGGYVIGDWRSCRTPVTVRSVIVAARRYSRFPRYLVLVELLSTISRNAPVTLFAIFFGTSAAGMYGQAQRLCGAPMTLLSQAVGRVFVGRVSSAHRSRGAAFRSVFGDVSVRLAIMAAIAVAAVAAAGVALPWIVGEEWKGIGAVLFLLLPSFFALFVVSPIAPSLDVLNRQGLHLRWEVMRLSAVVGWIVLGARLTMGFETVILGYSLVLTGCLALLYGICRRTIFESP